ncbi:MAG: S8 family serine peptidase, partial [Planctomycetota bacterium]|nr:S8 family serine peptidase [Planctomycetota bacterium]
MHLRAWLRKQHQRLGRRSADKRLRARRQSQRRLELLEPRLVLEGPGIADYGQVTPGWFGAVPQIYTGVDAVTTSGLTNGSDSRQTDAGWPRWIVRLNADDAGHASSPRNAEPLLNDGTVDFQVIRGLGLPGQVLVRAFATAADSRAALAANPHVAAFEADSLVQAQVLPNDPDFGSMTDLHNVGQFNSTLDADIDAPEAWDLNTGSTNVVVGVIDSGIDVTHPDLYLNVWLNQGEIPAGLKTQLSDTDGDGRITFYDLNDSANASLVRDTNGNSYIDAQDLLNDLHWGDGLDTDHNGFVDDFFGWNFRVAANEPFAPNDPRDTLGHGTHVAGTIGAVGDNGRGVTGINWRSSLMALKFLDDSNQGLTSDAVLAVNYATMMRTDFGEPVRVLNASWGQSGGYSSALRTAIEAAGEAGMLFIAAAGNGNILGQGMDIDRQPFYPASYDLDNIIGVAATGPNDELARFSNYGATSVDLGAPGIGVLSTLPGGRYGTANGTSMAAPHVAGAAALVWSDASQASLAEVRQAILGAANPLAQLDGLTVTGGRLNVHGALESDAFAPRVVSVTAPNITVAGGSDNLITIQYQDRWGMDETSLDDGDILVSRQWGPKHKIPATLVPGSVRVADEGRELTASYRVAAPDGTWDPLDYGPYLVTIVENEVSNNSGLTVPGASIGEFTVRIVDSKVFFVNPSEDAVDANVGDGICAGANGQCTLRAAVQEANAAAPAARTVILEKGTFELGIPPVPDSAVQFPTPAGCVLNGGIQTWSNDSTGDLDILGNITIVGDDAATSIVDADGMDRVFRVYPDATLNLQRIGMTGGHVTDVSGGGILSMGTLHLNLVTVANHRADGSSGFGGGLAIWGGVTTMFDSTVRDNQADSGGGLFVCNQATVDIAGSTLMTNVAAVGGGGVYAFRGAVDVTNSTLSSNESQSGSAIYASAAEDDYSFYFPSLSADGRFVAFESNSSNLVPGDTNGWRDVFVLDRQTRTVERVSVAEDGAQGNAESTWPSLSADGRFVAFQSRASNLVPGDTNDSVDVFVFDRQTRTIERVSVAGDGTQGDFDSNSPSLSADGRFVAFESIASNLVPGDTNGESDVFLFDLQNGTIERVSVAENGSQGNSSSHPSLSEDSRFVAFESNSSNLVPGDTNGWGDVFVLDRQAGTVEQVSVADDGTEGNGFSYFPSLSADGRFVAFESSASNLVTGDTNGASDMFVFDRESATIQRVSVANDGSEGNGMSDYPSLSADGRFVTFHSDASNLVPGDTNVSRDVFVFDRQTARIQRVSIADDGSQGSADSQLPVLSADGQFVAFLSFASNLVPNETKDGDMFVFDRQNGTLEWAGFASSSVLLESVTVAQNKTSVGAAVDGGPHTASIRPVRTHNSLFVANQLFDLIGSESLGHNLWEYAVVTPQASDQVVPYTQPVVGPLQPNGGPTWTHALIPGSFAIDAADPFDYPNADQRGLARPQDGDGQEGSRADIGAVELFYATIEGAVFLDRNRNGIREAVEPGMPGWPVCADLNSDGRCDSSEPQAWTREDDPTTFALQEDGWFSFGELSPGSLGVAIAIQADWALTFADLRRVSTAENGIQGNGSSMSQTLSADGRFVAFVSSASNLVHGDTNGQRDVFVVDRQSGSVDRVSVADDGTQGISGGGSYDTPPSLSADGRFVAFESSSSNLVPGDTNGRDDVFVFDRQTATVERVSVADDGTQSNRSSFSPSLSADGRFVAFESEASNLVPGDTNGQQDVFVFDRQTRTVARVSVAEDGTQGNDFSDSPTPSADGRFVAFRSSASNLVPGDINGFSDVFVFDRQAGTVERVSVADDGTQGNHYCYYPTLSADGRFVSFMSGASNLVPGDTNNRFDVFVFDRQTDSVERVSVANGGIQSNGFSYSPTLSADGRFVAFYSQASNLVLGDTNGEDDVFVVDRESGTIQRVSIAEDGTQGNGQSNAPTLSADGRFVAFASFASSLVSGDTNRGADVFVAYNSLISEAPTYPVWVYAGQVLSNVDLGVAPNPGEIRGRVFEDLIANGIYDAGEPGWEGSTVYLDVNGNEQRDPDEPATQAAADGSYFFSELPSYQDYQVGVVVPAGFTLVLPTPDENGLWKVFLPAGGSITDRDFGFREIATGGQFENGVLDGRVYVDLNGNGSQDAGEAGLVDVTLFLDLDNDGVRDFDEPGVFSASDDPNTLDVDETGRYSFDHLGNRPYTVRILEAAYHQQTTPVGNTFSRQAYSLAVPGNAQGSPQDVAVADFNGDGANDLATAVFDRNAVALLLNDGTGAFARTPLEIPLAPANRPSAAPRGFGPIALLAADFNRNGQPDLAVVNNISSNVTILLDFDGTRFASEVYVTVGVLPNAVISGDVDHDGDLDLVVTNEFNNNVSILRNDGQGHFTADAVAPTVGNHPFGVATGDFNEDGRLDLAVADFGTNPGGADLGDVRVLLADGSGGFQSYIACPVGFGPAALVVGDLDGDGHLDLAVANFLSDNVTVCRGHGNGTFTAVATLAGGSGPMDIDAVDLEGDGDLDLLVTSGKSEKVGILRNRVSQGVFEFEPAESFGVANFPGASQISLATGDLDGNGTVDLALANSQENNVVVHLNTLVGGAYRVALTGTETVTGLDFGLQPLDTTRKVAAFTPNSTGFVARFNWDLAASVLNLYDQGGVLGPADVTVVGATVGEVRGSLVVDPGLRQVTFIKTGGLLEPDTYTVTLVSGANAFRDTTGNVLDGNGDGTAGDNYTTSFVVAAPVANRVTVGLPDFARGYGQPVNLPANDLGAGLPLELSDGRGVSRVALTLHYDPSLLNVQAFTLNSTLASRGVSAQFSVVSPGIATLLVNGSGSFSTDSGPLTVGAFTAAVPATAPYGGKHVLDIADLHVFNAAAVSAELPAVDDDAIHVAAFFGDTSGSRGYNSPDVTLVQRLIGQINTGLSAYQLADPRLLADLTRNNLLQANDTVGLQRVIGQVPMANVP